MKIMIKTTILSLTLLNVAIADTIPMPDSIIYGQLSDNGEPVTPTKKMVVLARVDDIDVPVAVYHMGDLPAAGNAYVLHIARWLEADGKTLTSQTPSPGTTANIYFMEETGGEIFAGKVRVPEMGQASLMDIDISTVKLADDQTVGRPGFGGLCGAMGMISFGWIGMGLITLRRLSIFSRRHN